MKRHTNENTGKTNYTLSNGNFKDYMRKSIIKSKIVSQISGISNSATYTDYLPLSSDETSLVALKMLSIFDYITYEVVGGEAPEIFIRLNDPNKIRSIVMGNTPYSNKYVKRAREKHDRDIEVLLHFFNDLTSDIARWDYIENYFLGYDVLYNDVPQSVNPVKMINAVEKEHSYQTTGKTWDDLMPYFYDSDKAFIEKLVNASIRIPEYLETEIKKSETGNDIIMSWPSRDTLICQQATPDTVMEFFRVRGWHAFRIDDIDYESLKKELM